MSRYETLRTELGRLKIWQALAVMALAAATAILFVLAAGTGTAKLLTAMATIVVVPLIFHQAWRLTFPTYRGWANRSSDIRAEIARLQKRIAMVFDEYRERQKGEHFKQAYDHAGRSSRAGYAGARPPQEGVRNSRNAVYKGA
jgi:hypothetical protein